MAQLDPSIILQAGNYKTPDLGQTLAQVANLKAQGQESQLRDLQIGAANRDNQTRTLLSNAFDPQTGQIDPVKAQAAFGATGDYQGAYKFNTDRLAAQNAQIDNALKLHGAISQVLGGVQDQASLDAARAELGKNPATAQGAAQLPQVYDEAGAAQIQGLRKQGQTVGEQLQQQQAAVTQAHNEAVLAETKRANGVREVNATPEAKGKAAAAVAEAELPSKIKLEEAKNPTLIDASGKAVGTMGSPTINATAPGYSSAPLPSAGGLTQAALDQSAILFATTGKFPTGMGIGSTGQGGQRKVAIQNRAAELDAGGNLSANAAQLKALSSSLSQQTTYANTTERAVTNAENGYQQLHDAFMGKVNNSKLPLVNAITNAAKYQLDPGDISAFRAGLTEVANEYANVFSRGGTMTDAVREQAKKIADGNLSIDDMGKVLNELQLQGKIVINGAKAQATKIQGQLNGILSPQGAGAAAVPAPAAAPGAPVDFRAYFGTPAPAPAPGPPQVPGAR